MTIPQWEACKVCGGDHWTKDHDDGCPVCGHEHLGYSDESCVSCGCDWVFIRDNYDKGMKARLVAALAAIEGSKP